MRVERVCFGQEPSGDLEQGGGGRFTVVRHRQANRTGEPARRRHAELRRPDKGEQFEEVERGEGGPVSRKNVEAPRHRPCMAHHRALVLEPGARLGRRQRLHFALR